jgi:hypothetical protein
MMSKYLNMTNEGLCIQKRFITWLKVMMMLLLMVTICKKKKEDGTNDDQRLVKGAFELLQNTN